MSETIVSLIMEYFEGHPNENVNHGPVVDWVSARWLKTHKTPPRDPWRTIRKLHQDGILIKVQKGVYRYEPTTVAKRELEDFTPIQKQQIFERDGYRCVICGLGIADGVEIHADHIRPKDLGGRAEVANGQTLCAKHNFRKKNYKQTETGKKMFIRLYELAREMNDIDTMEFCRDVLNMYEVHHINDHIKWKRE